MKKTAKLRGVVPVLVTPFGAGECVDEESLRKEVDFVIDSGASAICTPAFASEHYKLSDTERYRVAEIVAERAASRVPLFVSTSSASVHSTVEFSRFARSIGAVGVMASAPTVVSLRAEEVIAYFGAVCQAVGFPVMIQDADFLR